MRFESRLRIVSRRGERFLRPTASTEPQRPSKRCPRLPQGAPYSRRDQEFDVLSWSPECSLVAAWSATVAAPTASAISRTAASRDSIRSTRLRDHDSC